MSAIPQEKLDRVVERWEAIQAELSRGGLNQASFARLSKEFAGLDPLVAAIRELRAAEKERRDLVARLKEFKVEYEDNVGENIAFYDPNGLRIEIY